MKKLDQDLPIDDRLIPDARAAEALGVSLMTLWRWTKKGLIRAVQINHRNYRRLGDVRALQRAGNVSDNGVAAEVSHGH